MTCQIGTMNPYEGASECMACQAGTYGIMEGQWQQYTQPSVVLQRPNIIARPSGWHPHTATGHWESRWVDNQHLNFKLLLKLPQEPPAVRWDARMHPLAHMSTRSGKQPTNSASLATTKI